MIDRENVITHLQIIHTWAAFARERDLQFFTAKHLEDIAQWAYDALTLLKADCHNCKLECLLQKYDELKEKYDALLKEQNWHIFHENEDGVMDVECIPNNGEEFLWYRKHSGDMIVAPWGDDDWAEYACTADGEPFEDGDAWMELPKPPKQ